MKNTTNMMSTAFAAEYPIAATEYRNAVKLLEMEMVIGCLTSARVSLESVVKEICRKCGVDTSDANLEIKLQDMIDALGENGIVSAQELSVLHRIRILCNRGAHPGETLPDLDDAREAVELLSNALNFLAESDTNADFEEKAAQNNQPEMKAEYYSLKRRYRGEWSECYTREDLAVIPEYVELVRRADEGDISAMLDLAIGFVSKNPVWSSDQLVCMPKFRARGKEYYQERAYDTRYYYWIIKACDHAIDAMEQGASYPRKYMANAFLDAMKFALSVCAYEVKFYVSDVQYGRTPEEDQLVYANQYQLVEDLYGFDLRTFYENSFCWARELVKMIGDAESERIISNLHYRENNLMSIKYLAYCFACVHRYFDATAEITGTVSGMKNCVLDSEMAMLPEDIGASVTMELLAQRIPGNMRGTAYYQLTCDVCNEIGKEANKQKNHPKLAAMEATGSVLGDKIRSLAADSPLVYRLLSNGIFTPMVAAVLGLSWLIENAEKTVLLVPVLLLVVGCVWVYSKLWDYYESVPVPGRSDGASNRWICNLLNKVVPVVIVVTLLMLGSGVEGLFAKVMVYAAAAACVFFSQTLRKILGIAKSAKRA